MKFSRKQVLSVLNIYHRAPEPERTPQHPLIQTLRNFVINMSFWNRFLRWIGYSQALPSLSDQLIQDLRNNPQSQDIPALQAAQTLLRTVPFPYPGLSASDEDSLTFCLTHYLAVERSLSADIISNILNRTNPQILAKIFHLFQGHDPLIVSALVKHTETIHTLLERGHSAMISGLVAQPATLQETLSLAEKFLSAGYFDPDQDYTSLFKLIVTHPKAQMVLQQLNTSQDIKKLIDLFSCSRRAVQDLLKNPQNLMEKIEALLHLQQKHLLTPKTCKAIRSNRRPSKIANQIILFNAINQELDLRNIPVLWINALLEQSNPIEAAKVLKILYPVLGDITHQLFSNICALGNAVETAHQVKFFYNQIPQLSKLFSDHNECKFEWVDSISYHNVEAVIAWLKTIKDFSRLSAAEIESGLKNAGTVADIPEPSGNSTALAFGEQTPPKDKPLKDLRRDATLRNTQRSLSFEVH